MCFETLHSEAFANLISSSSHQEPMGRHYFLLEGGRGDLDSEKLSNFPKFLTNSPGFISCLITTCDTLFSLLHADSSGKCLKLSTQDVSVIKQQRVRDVRNPECLALLSPNHKLIACDSKYTLSIIYRWPMLETAIQCPSPSFSSNTHLDHVLC